MVKIVQRKVHSWRNAFAHHPVALTTFSLGKLHDLQVRTKIYERIGRAVFRNAPSLRSNSDADDVMLWMARCVQSEFDIAPALSGIIETSNNGNKTLWTAFGDRSVAHMPAEIAIGLAAVFESIAPPSEAAIAQTVAQLDEKANRAALDTPGRAIAREASRRGIPFGRQEGRRDHVVLGWGHRRHLSHHIVSQDQSVFAPGFAKDKFASLSLFSAHGLPAGSPAEGRTTKELSHKARSLGYPVVLKAPAGAQGRDVVPRIRSEDELVEAASALLTKHQRLLIQRHFEGEDHRFLVVDDCVVGVAKRIPARVVSDGVASVRALVEAANRDPRRGLRHRALMTRIALDDEAIHCLREIHLTPESVPANGQHITLKRTANISAGGTAVDVTDIAHPDNLALARRAARLIGLRIAGVDLITKDISKSWRETGGGICEINHSPAFRPHWIGNPDRDVVGPVVECFMRGRGDGRIPTAMITGSEGRNTTCLMLAAILKAAGHRVGLTGKDRTSVECELIQTEELSVAPDALTVLNDPDVTAAVLETSYGELIERGGLAIEHCDVGAFLNIASDQLDANGPDALEDIFAAKRKVTDAARHARILNLDDDIVARLLSEYRAASVIGFTVDKGERFSQLVANGGRALFLRAAGTPDEAICIADGEGERALMRSADIAGTGTVANRVTVLNAMAASGLALGLGLSPDQISAALGSGTSLDNAGGASGPVRRELSL